MCVSISISVCLLSINTELMMKWKFPFQWRLTFSCKFCIACLFGYGSMRRRNPTCAWHWFKTWSYLVPYKLIIYCNWQFVFCNSVFIPQFFLLIQIYWIKFYHFGFFVIFWTAMVVITKSCKLKYIMLII